MLHFEKNLMALNNGVHPSLDRFRSTAFESFKVQGIPTRKNEDWKYTNTKEIQSATFSITSADKAAHAINVSTHIRLDEINLVFIDGVFSHHQSSHPTTETAKNPNEESSAKAINSTQSGLTIEGIATSLEGSLETNHTSTTPTSASIINNSTLIEDNGFTALNRALIDIGFAIKVEANTKIERPIHILHVHSNDNPNSASFPRVVITLEQNAELNLIETHLSASQIDDSESSLPPSVEKAVQLYTPFLTNTVMDIHLKDGANLAHTKTQAQRKESFHISHTHVSQDRDSTYEGFYYESGSKISRNSISVALNGEGAHATLNGLYISTGTQHIDNHISVDHKAPNCTSRQFFKGILGGHSRAVFGGKIFVRKDAQKTAAFQTNNNLVLSNNAEIDTKPQLEIDADDVKCSHGATIGQLNQNEIFYLMARGITKSEANKMLCKGFAQEAILKINSETMRTHFDVLLENDLNAL